MLSIYPNPQKQIQNSKKKSTFEGKDLTPLKK